jgi:MFS family permease
MGQSKRIKKSLTYSVVEGSFWAVMFGFGETYLTAFAIFLRANNIQIGLLTSLPLLIGSISQFFTLRLIDVFKSRKKFVVITALIQALTWIPIIAVFYFNNWSVYFLIVFAVIYWVSGMIAAPAWNSWISDLVEPGKRGSYFGKRSKIIGLITLVSIIGGGIVLDLFKNGVNKQYLGFVILFLAALVTRLVSAFFLNKKYEPKLEVKKEDEFSFIAFLKQIRFRNYGMFVIFLTLMNFSVYMAAPFFVAYWLYDLKLTYLAYMTIIATSFIAKYISLPVWGALSDKYGTRKILSLTGYLMPLVPLLWMASTKFYYLIFVQIYSGIVWAGFDLSAFNFVFDTTTPQKRARCISYYNIINGIMIFLGATIGSLIIRYNQIFWTKYYLVFLISAALRYGVSIFLLPKLKEARKVSQISYEGLLFKGIHMLISQSFKSITSLPHLHLFRHSKRL